MADLNISNTLSVAPKNRAPRNPLNERRYDRKRRSNWSDERRKQENERRSQNLLRAKELSPWTQFIRAAGRRAQERNLEFDLTEEWGRARWTGYCEVSGVKFKLDNKTKGPMALSPSIDRINSSLGYTQENSRFVLLSVNMFRGYAFDDSDMLMIARAITEKSAGVAQLAAALVS